MTAIFTFKSYVYGQNYSAVYVKLSVMLDIQVKRIPLRSFSCFIDEAWIQKDPEKFNCKDNSESVLSAVRVSRILHLFLISIYGAIKTHPRLCKDWGIPHLSKGSGGEACQPAKKQMTKERGFRLRGCSDWHCVSEGSGSAAQLLQGCQQLFESCQGAGCQWQKWAEWNICFLWLPPKKQRGTFCCFNALGWRALKGFPSAARALVLCCFPQPTSSRRLKTKAL